MSDLAIYWRGWQESKLAAFQQDQGSTNHCAKYASATAMNLLSGSSISGNSLIAWLENRLFRGSLRYTILGNNLGSLVFQTANQIRLLSFINGIKLKVHYKRGRVADLIAGLKESDSIILVSVTYFKGEEPVISRGQRITSSLAAGGWVGGHIMILSAFDPFHKNQEGVGTPWGFLSSWGSKDELYWMTDEDFRHTWGRLSFFNMITVSRHQEASQFTEPGI